MRRLATLLAILASSFSLRAESVLGVSKTTFEAITCSVSFVATDGVTPVPVTLISVTASNARGFDVTSTIVAASPVPAVVSGPGNQVAFRLQNGDTSSIYRVSVKATNNATGDSLEGVMLLTITKN